MNAEEAEELEYQKLVSHCPHEIPQILYQEIARRIVQDNVKSWHQPIPEEPDNA